MKCKVVEIRWHDTTPIFSVDFHSVAPTGHAPVVHPFMKTGGGVESTEEHKEVDESRNTMWRLATCGGDKNVRLWLVHPRPPPPAPKLTLAASASQLPAQPLKPLESTASVEYLATLSQHTGVVNVVRFSPVGEMLASAGDDGNVIFWIPGESAGSFGETAEDKAYEREKWRVKSMCRTRSGQEIYDLAFSPDGAYILTGSVDHTANIYDVATGQLVHTIAEHTNYVQGVAWDPHNHYIATQSSDRSMHVYSVAQAHNSLQVHAVGKNSRMEVQHHQGGTWRPPTPAATPSSSNSHDKSNGKGKEVESRPPLHHRAESDRSEASSSAAPRPSTSTSALDDDYAMDPPAAPRAPSRRSSTSGSHPSQSPSLAPQHPRGPLRSPSPAPLPAIKVPLSPSMSASPGADGGKIESLKLYTDANSTPFFRRLAWSTDGSLLLTPAGLFEDPYASVEKEKEKDKKKVPIAPVGSSSSKKKEASTPSGSKTAAATTSDKVGPKPTVYIYSRSNVARPPIAHLPGHTSTSIAIRFCPILWQLRPWGAADEDGEEKPPVSVELEVGKETDVKLGGPSSEEKGKQKGEGEKLKSLFDLPYRMVYAVATLDIVYLYDTQQASPIAMFSNLHYAPFTDLTWSPDGNTLVLSAQDGYCTVVSFEPLELGTPYEDQSLPVLPASLVPTPVAVAVAVAPAPAPATIPALFNAAPAVKREFEDKKEVEGEPAKKKKKAALIHHGPLGTTAPAASGSS